jgi:hypothetical protein
LSLLRNRHQEHPQCLALLTSFSTWGTENSLTVINLESTGSDKGFLGPKIGEKLQFCGRAHYRATSKNIDSRTQLEEPAECASGSYPFLLYKILHFPLVRILFAPRL